MARSAPEIPAHATLAPTAQRGARWEVPSAAHKALGLWVRAAGYSNKSGPGLGKPRVLGNYAAVYVVRGKGYFESPPSGRREVEAGALWWLFPEVQHQYRPYENWDEQWVIFDGPQAETYERLGYMRPENPVVQVGFYPQVAEIFERFKEEFIHGKPLAVPYASALVHQLVVVVHGLATGQMGDSTPEDALVAEALKLIEREATKALTPENLAARLHVGYSTLRRHFKQQTGYALKEYILGVQLKRAKELLAFTNRPVQVVSEQAGFEDPYYFSRLFRKREGVPPSVFRERQSRMAGR
ncbi:MAG: AraC family transcriptional regulator [Planctomycetota bacterium]|nr:AraC family transcriptional regulator [Planctomycetota bacterium]